MADLGLKLRSSNPKISLFPLHLTMLRLLKNCLGNICPDPYGTHEAPKKSLTFQNNYQSDHFKEAAQN